MGQPTTLVSPIAFGNTRTKQDGTCDAMSVVIQCAVCRDARHAKAAGTYIGHDPLQVDSSDERNSMVMGCPKVFETYRLEIVMEHPKTHA